MCEMSPPSSAASLREDQWVAPSAGLRLVVRARTRASNRSVTLYRSRPACRANSPVQATNAWNDFGHAHCASNQFLAATVYSDPHVSVGYMNRDARNQQGLLTLIALGFFSLSLVCIGIGAFHDPGREAHRFSLGSGLFMGVGLAAAAARVRSDLDELLSNNYVYLGSVTFLSFLIFGLTWWCGMRQFGGFDQSMVIDFGWRLYSGQQPYSDFPTTVPPSFFLVPYYAFSLFSVRWQSLILIFAAFGFVTFWWSLWLISQLYERRRDQVVLAVALQALCLIPVSYWWYNPTTATSGVVFALSASLFMKRPFSGAAQVSYTLALIILLTMKPNVAGLLILPITAILLSSREHMATALAMSSIAIVAVVLWLRLHGIDVNDIITSYRDVSARGLMVGQFFIDATILEILASLLALIVVLIPIVICVLRRRSPLEKWQLVGIGGTCAVAGVNSFVTAGETKVVDLGIVLFGVAMVCHARNAFRVNSTDGAVFLSRSLGGYVMAGAIVLSCIGIAVGVTRHRVLGIGIDRFFEYAMEKDAFDEGFFDGLRTGVIFKDTYAQVQSVVSHSTNQQIYFGPRMQWAYAAFGQMSPPHQPVWWQAGVAFSEKEEGTYVNRFIAARYDTLVFLKDDMTYYPATLRNAILDNYVEDQRNSRLTVYRRTP